ncbi:MAG: DUF6516 family protein [Pseudomonadota bacterium]|jgi:hypothetical protein
MDYDGYELVFEQGYVARFEFRKESDPEANPHPYKYSLTLHAPSGKRLLGFDNAHPVEWKSGRFRKRSKSSDHWHRDASDKGRPYQFESPQKLLDDFLKEVERVLRECGVAVEPLDTRSSK